ncbi:MAG: dienelactone hydrolase family protein [Cytophagales bacterium]|nr:dienelactone hydrolase family protein [Armatimonadota bacterium]
MKSPCESFLVASAALLLLGLACPSESRAKAPSSAPPSRAAAAGVVRINPRAVLRGVFWFGLVCALFSASVAFAQRTDFPSTEMPPVILRDTRPEEWPDLRSRIQTRLRLYLGERPATAQTAELKFEETGRDQVSGLTRIHYRYHVMDDAWTEGALILPPDLKAGERRSVMLIIHGTHDLGKATAMDEKNAPRRAYAIELARRGYVTFAPDLFGYGKPVDSTNRQGYLEKFDEQYPKWSQADRIVFGLQKALDLLDRLPMVRAGEYGAMGNSLGGGSTLRLMATDTRIKVGVASTGVSPQSTNIYRLVGKQKGARADFDAIVKKTGRVPYEITDMLALCAPRSLLVIEPFNDPYNPDVGATFSAVRNAWMVWNLLDAPTRASMLVHGDGHDTVDEVRNSAYGWIERWLPARTTVMEATR